MGKVTRPPLTKKAIAAIRTYVRLRTIEQAYVETVIEHTLNADRMDRDKLYDWLSKHGQVWDSKRRRWRLKQ